MDNVDNLIKAIKVYCPTDQIALDSILKEDDLGELFSRLQVFIRIHSNLKINIEIVKYSIANHTFTTTPECTHQLCQLFESIFSQTSYSSFPHELQEDFICWLSLKIVEQQSLSDDKILLQLLTLLNFILKDKSSHSKKVYLALGGPAGALIKVLDCQSSSLECHCQAAKGLHLLSYIPQDLLHHSRGLNECIYPPEVTASIQRIALLQLRQLIICLQFTEEISILAASCLTILYNLVICVPDDILGGTVLNASFPFAFYGLPVSKGIHFVECNAHSSVEVSQISDGDSDSVCRTYTNRNRRKRLRRMRAQPSRSTIEPKLPDASSFRSTRSNPLFVPKSFTTGHLGAPQVSLKPQWMMSHSSPLKDVNKVALDSTGKSFISEKQTHCNSPTGPKSDSPECKDPNSNSTATPFTEKGESNLSMGERITGAPNHQKIMSSELNAFSQVDLEISHFEKGPLKFSLLEAKVRRSALILINSIINKAGRQNKFSFWPQMMCQTASLMSCAMRDPSICVRMAALQVINTFLMDSQNVLKMAVDEKDTGSYSTLGRQLGTSIRELHRCLALCLLSERVPNVLVRILKTIELLIENINYANFKPGLLTKIITHVKYFLRYKEAVVRANAFSVMVSLLMKRPRLPELKALLMKYQTPAPQSLSKPPNVRPPSPYEEELPDTDEGIEEDALGNRLDASLTLSSEEEITSDSSCDSERPNTMVSWIIHRCVDSLLLHGGGVGQGMYVQVQLQSLKVLSALVSEHLTLMKSSIPLIQHVIAVCSKIRLTSSMHEIQPMDMGSIENRGSSDENDHNMSHDPALIIEHSFLLLASLLGSIKYEVEKRKEIDEPSAAHLDQSFTPDEALQLWLWALQDPLQPLFGLQEDTKMKKDKSPSACDILPLKPLTAAANVLSQLSACVLDSLGETWLCEILQTVSFLLHNEEYELQLCGIRIVGFTVGYSSVREHMAGPELIQTVSQLSISILSSKERHVNKDRIMAAWALANISSALSAYKETWKQRLRREEPFLSSKLILSYLDSCILGCQDKDKIKPHAVRSIGNLVAFLTSDMDHFPGIEHYVNKAMENLIDCSVSGNNMKMRWNACHALGNILSSPNIQLEGASWRSAVIQSLSQLTEQFKNYKVRIQASIALCQVETRRGFGPEYVCVWKSYLRGLDNVGNVVDFQEITHRDDLVYQICIGLCHLTQLLQLDDLDSLSDLITLHKDAFHSSLLRSNENLTAEKASCFIKAHQHVKDLEESDALTLSQQSCLDVLSETLKL